MGGIDSRIQVEGVDELLHRLSRAVAVETRAEPMLKLVERLRARLANYPPPPPASSYERTGALGQGWAMEGAVQADAIGTNQFADRVSVELINPVEYASWVQDPQMQAQVHRGRWKPTDVAVAGETASFLSDLTDSIDNALGGH